MFELDQLAKGEIKWADLSPRAKRKKAELDQIRKARDVRNQLPQDTLAKLMELKKSCG